jgi:hypothetical protein
MPFLFGSTGLIVLYFLSSVFTRSLKPLALACGKNKEISPSQMQFLIFTAITIFCYSTTFSAWIIYHPTEALDFPKIPVNLLILMGLSVVTTSSSKGITMSYLRQGQLSGNDKSNLFSNREGTTDLNKVQMFAWTIISSGIYIVQFITIVNNYVNTRIIYLPDIDSTLLILMGISQGGYVGGKLVQKNIKSTPLVELIAPANPKIGQNISIIGEQFGTKEGNSILITDQNGVIIDVPSDDITEWSDTKIILKVSEVFMTKEKKNFKCYLQLRVGGTNSKLKEFEISI